MNCTHRGYCVRLLGVLMLVCVGLSGCALAKNNPSYTQVGHNISIGPNQEVGELTCFGCSIRVRGQVAGDVTTFGGWKIPDRWPENSPRLAATSD
jgi:hypothetical protein